MKYFLRGIIAAILFGVLMIGGLMTGFMVLCYLAVPPMLYMYYCLFQVIIAIIKVMAKGASKTVEVGTKVASLPRKMKQEAEAEKERKEREQVEANLQAKIKAEAAPYKAMADNGDVGAIKEIAKVYYKNGKKDEAQKLYEEVAQLGDIDAQLKLADNYRHVLSAEEWASKAEKNPNASDGQKEYAQKLKNEIKEYGIEAYQRFRDAEAAKWRRIEEAQRRREAEMNLPVQGDFFAVRPGESCCMNDGNACRFCARRVWVSSEGWCRSSRCYL